MLKRSSIIVSNAHYRAQAYFALLAWLVRFAFSRFAKPIGLSAAATACSVVFQGLALAIVVGAVGQLQDSGHLTTFPGVDRLGLHLPAPRPGLVIGSFVFVFVLGSMLAYYGRKRAIRLESDMYRYCYHTIVEFFSRHTENTTALLTTLWTRRIIAKRYALLRVLTSDARFAGVIVRLALFNITHLGNIAVGLLIIGLYAPVLLPVIGMFAVLAALFMYPLNLRATRSTRLLEEEAVRRSRLIRDKVGFLLGAKPAMPIAFDDPELQVDDDLPVEDGGKEREEHEIIDNFLHLMESRLMVLESSRILMGSMVGVGIGCMVWLMFADQHEGIISYSSLLVLFFGLRFVMNGIEGAMVTITSINRFLPHLLRLRDLVNGLTTLQAWPTGDSGSNDGRIRREATLVNPITTSPRSLPARQAHGGLPFALNTAGLQQIESSFAPGEVYALQTPAQVQRSAGEQIRLLLRARDTTIEAVSPSAVQSLTDHEEAEWLARVMAEANRVASPTPPGRDESAADDDQLAAYLAGCLRHARESASLVVVLDGFVLRRLSPRGMLAVTRLFAASTVFVHSHVLDDLRANVPSGELLVSDGQNILCLLDAVSIRPQARDFIDSLCGGDWKAGRQRYEAAAAGFAPAC